MGAVSWAAGLECSDPGHRVWQRQAGATQGCTVVTASSGRALGPPNSTGPAFSISTWKALYAFPGEESSPRWCKAQLGTTEARHEVLVQSCVHPAVTVPWNISIPWWRSSPGAAAVTHGRALPGAEQGRGRAAHVPMCMCSTHGPSTSAQVPQAGG